MKKEPTTKKKKKLIPLKLSPSLWQTWQKCALSLQNPSTTLRADADGYAAQGTSLHAQIAEALQNPEQKLLAMDDDDAQLVRFAVDTTLDIFKASSPIPTMLVEHYLFAKVAGVTISGTADCIISEDDTVVIIDHKTGWKEVEAEGNKQLKLYAHLYAKGKAITKWKGIIINARFNSTSYTGGNIEKTYLSDVVADIKTRTTEKQLTTGNHCAYCPRLTICAPLRAEIKKWIEPGAIDGLTRRPAELADAIRLAKPAEKLFDTVKKEAQLYIDLGGVIPGMTLEYTAGTRTWPRDMSIVEIADKIGLNGEDMVEVKTISPAEAEKRGASKEAINALAIRPPRKGFSFK